MGWRELEQPLWFQTQKPQVTELPFQPWATDLWVGTINKLLPHLNCHIFRTVNHAPHAFPRAGHSGAVGTDPGAEGTCTQSALSERVRLLSSCPHIPLVETHLPSSGPRPSRSNPPKKTLSAGFPTGCPAQAPPATNPTPSRLPSSPSTPTAAVTPAWAAAAPPWTLPRCSPSPGPMAAAGVPAQQAELGREALSHGEGGRTAGPTSGGHIRTGRCVPTCTECGHPRGGTGGCPSGPHSLQRAPSSRHHPVVWMKSREVKRLTLDCTAAQIQTWGLGRVPTLVPRRGAGGRGQV